MPAPNLQREQQGHHWWAAAQKYRVERDPCSYCGTRADVGCRHRLRAA